MIIYKEPIKKQNDETWGQIPVPMFFSCEATKIHGLHGRHRSFLRWCSGKGHTEINHRNLDGILAKLSYKVVCFTLPSAAAPRCATLQ